MPILEVHVENQPTHDSERQDSAQEKWKDPFGWPSQSVAYADPRSQMPQMGADMTVWRVLLVDDNEMVRELIKLQLEQLGYHVLCAKNGIEALECFRKRHDEICLVLSDVIMPEMDGWATLAAIKGIRQDTPVVLASGSYEIKAELGKHSQKPQALLQKPFKKKVLKETLDRVLGCVDPADPSSGDGPLRAGG